MSKFVIKHADAAIKLYGSYLERVMGSNLGRDIEYY
jgi:hypothetical protein